MSYRQSTASLVCAALFLAAAVAASAQYRPQQPSAIDPGNRLYNAFRTQFKPAWTVALQDPVKLIDIGPVTDPRKSNLVLLIGGKTDSDTQRKLRITHWNGNSFDTDGEMESQSIGIDTLILGHFHPGPATPVTVSAPAPAAPANGKPQKPPKKEKPRAAPAHTDQVLTNAGIYTWSSGSLQPLFARQLPDVKQSLMLDNHTDMVIVGVGEGALPYEFTETEMRPAVRERLQGGGYAHFGVGMQPFTGSDAINLAPGVRYVQAVWTGRTKWLIGLVRGKSAPLLHDPGATTGDRLVVYTPRFNSHDKTFWESRMGDLEEAWRSDPFSGHVLDVRVGDPHNDGKPGILVLSSENDDKDRRLSFFAATGPG